MIEKTKVRNWLTYESGPEGYEPENKLPSMTIPDLSISVKELVDRMQMGLPPEGERVAVFDEGKAMPDLSRMDLADRQLFIKFYQDELNNLLTPKEATEAANAQLANEKEEKKIAEAALDDLLIKD